MMHSLVENFIIYIFRLTVCRIEKTCCEN